MSSNFNIGQKKINISDIFQIISENQFLSLSPSSKSKIIKSRVYLSKKIKKSDDLVYGVNTGFGSLCDKKIDDTKINQLQENLILSHACGVGDRVP